MSFFNKTIDFLAASLAIPLCSSHKRHSFLVTSAYGFSNKPTLNFSLNIFLTASSTYFSSTFPSSTICSKRVSYKSEPKSISVPASIDCFTASSVSNAVPWFTHSLIALASLITTPLNPKFFRSRSCINHSFVVHGTPDKSLNAIITDAHPSLTAASYGG